MGPRDGLQNEKKAISLETKLELIRRLAGTGVTHLEAGSFVPAKWVPQVWPQPPDLWNIELMYADGLHIGDIRDSTD